MASENKVQLVLEVSPEQAALINFILRKPFPSINEKKNIYDTEVPANDKLETFRNEKEEAAPVSLEEESRTQADFTASISDADSLTEMVTTSTVEGAELDKPASVRFEESHRSIAEEYEDDHVERSASPPPRIPSPVWSKEEEEEFIDIADKAVRASAYQPSEMPTANEKEEDRRSSPRQTLPSTLQYHAFDSTTSLKQMQPQAQSIPSSQGKGGSEYKEHSDLYSGRYTGIQHDYQTQPKPRTVFKVVKEIRHPEFLGHQPILNNGWTDNAPSADFTRKGFSSSPSASSSYTSKSSGYSTSHSGYSSRHHNEDSEAADNGWVVTPMRPVSDAREGGDRGGGRGKGGGNKRDFDDRPNRSHHSSSSSSSSSASSHSTTGQWSWSDKGAWVPFDGKTNYALETAYQNGFAQEKYFAGGNHYCVDFNEMRQYRLMRHGSKDIKKFRAVQRVPTSTWQKLKQNLSFF